MQEKKYQELAHIIERQSSLVSFGKYIFESKSNKEELYNLIKDCKVNSIKCRFNVWRLTLGVMSIDSDPEDKKQQIQQNRALYLQKKEQTLNIIRQISKTGKEVILSKNPLMKTVPKVEKAPTIINEDEFLREEIKKDVDRTYQELFFFQNSIILKLISNILFVWCKLNPVISYKQGMNQILASIVYVYFQSAFFSKELPPDFDQVSQQYKCSKYRVKNLHIFINNVGYAEPDIFAVFDKVMTIQKQMYKEEMDSNQKSQINPNSKNNSPILHRIKQIHDHKLKILDFDLFRTIKLQDVQTKSFLLRWIRCMHTRQFSLLDSFTIWDSIFLDHLESPNNIRFQFIDAMCLGMFVYMRSITLSKETTNQILQTYQKFPSLTGTYLEELINLVWSIAYALRQNNEETKTQNKMGFVPKANLNEMIKQQKETEEKYKKQLILQSEYSPKKQQKQQINNQLQTMSPVNKITPNNNKNQPVLPPVQDFTGVNITFQYQQWKEIQTLLKKSVKLNQDLQSKSLCNKAIRLIQHKVKQQASKIK